MTHLQVLQISMKFLLQLAFDIKKNTVNVLGLKDNLESW